jgi:hypothetical protein
MAGKATGPWHKSGWRHLSVPVLTEFFITTNSTPPSLRKSLYSSEIINCI